MSNKYTKFARGLSLTGYEASALNWLRRFPDAPNEYKNNVLKTLDGSVLKAAKKIVKYTPQMWPRG